MSIMRNVLIRMMLRPGPVCGFPLSVGVVIMSTFVLSTLSEPMIFPLVSILLIFTLYEPALLTTNEKLSSVAFALPRVL